MRLGTAVRWWRQDRMRMRMRLLLWTLICLAGFATLVSAQSGFINIDCGGSRGANYVDSNNFTWEADAQYLLAGGATASVASGRVGSLSVPLQTLTYFPAGSSPKKNCYVVPAQTAQVYLVRASFFYGNYDGKQQTALPGTFQLALDSTPWIDVAVLPNSTEPLVLEAITVPVTGTELSVCLIRTDDAFTPFINTLEVRPAVGSSSYTHTPVGGILHLLSRANFGERVTTYRYPLDPMDRIWPPYAEVYPDLVGQVTDISTAEPIVNGAFGWDVPPQVVMQTAVTSPSLFNFTTVGALAGSPSRVLYLSMFFAEYNKTLAPADELAIDVSYSFLQLPNGNLAAVIPVAITPTSVPALSTYQLRFWNLSMPSSFTSNDISWYFFKNVNSTLAPVISAVELYATQRLAISTSNVDGRVLSTLSKEIVIPAWGGDPCFPVSWDEIQCTTEGRVTSLNLSGKNLTGQIPADIGGLNALTSLNLSRNNFAGVIPSELGQLTSLDSLDVSNNQLSGAFPNWLTLRTLTELDVSNNNLSGTFPDSFLRLGSSFRYSGNPQLLCSGPSCPPSSTPTPPASPPPPPPSKASSTSSIGPVVGGIVGGVVFILLLGLLLFCCLRRRPEGKKHSPPVMPDGAETLQLGARGQAKPFTLRAIEIATSNYSRQIGVGGFGPVFHGVLADDREVAVKRMSATSEQGFKEFTTEIDLLSTIHHRNLVSLIGYCQESSELILLYEYMAGGDLRHRLYGRIADDKPLSWIERLQIALDSAKGLEYLHHGCNPRIIHRDVKSTNILLTSSLQAKFSDFGISKLTGDGKSHVTTMVKGTLGYMDPEYYQTGMLTDKSDVFSFGVVLLEILCGQPPAVSDDTKVPSHQRSLTDRVRSAVNSGNIDTVVDPRLAGRYRSESAWKFVETATSCVSSVSSQRPNFVQIVANLKQAMDIENPTPQVEDSTNNSSTSGYSNYPGGSSSSGPFSRSGGFYGR